MGFLRKHWQDIGGFLAIVVIGFLFVKGNELSNYQLLLWLSLVSLFLHQLEEYRIVGTFPGMMNSDVVGILKIIDWMKNKNSNFVFSKRNLLPANR